MKKINNNWYDRREFLTYKLRLIVEITDKKDIVHKIDLYTTQTDKDLVLDDISEMTTDKVKSFQVIHIATKEQDDLASELIEEWLNEK